MKNLLKGSYFLRTCSYFALHRQLGRPDVYYILHRSGKALGVINDR